MASILPNDMQRESSSVTISSRATHVDEGSYDEGKSTPQPPKEPYEVEAFVQEPGRASAPWHRRLATRLAPRYPRIARLVRYIQGPRPKRDLSGALSPLTAVPCCDLTPFDHRTDALPQSHLVYRSPCAQPLARALPHPHHPPLHEPMAICRPRRRIHHRLRILRPSAVVPDAVRLLHRVHGDVLGCEQRLRTERRKL